MDDSRQYAGNSIFMVVMKAVPRSPRQSVLLDHGCVVRELLVIVYITHRAQCILLYLLVDWKGEPQRIVLVKNPH